MTIRDAIRAKRNEISDTEDARDQAWAGVAPFRAAVASAQSAGQALVLRQAAETKASNAAIATAQANQRAAEDKVAGLNAKLGELQSQLAALEAAYIQETGSHEIVSDAEKAKFGL